MPQRGTCLAGHTMRTWQRWLLSCHGISDVATSGGATRFLTRVGAMRRPGNKVRA